MIAKSDLFILVVSASLLAVGIYRWQHNVSVAAANSAQVQRVVPAANNTLATVNPSQAVSSQTTIAPVTSIQTSTPIVANNQDTNSTQVVVAVEEPVAPAIIVESDAQLLGRYIVVSGDYLAKIAERFGTTVDTLQEINNISGTLIEVGQEIQFPLPAN